MTVQLEQYGNYPLGFNLVDDLLTTDNTLTPPSYDGWPTSGQMRIMIQSEFLLITDLATHPWPIQHAIEGTTAVDHLAGVPVYAIFTAGGVENLIGFYINGTLVATGRTIDLAGGSGSTAGFPVWAPLLAPAPDYWLEDPSGFPIIDPFTGFPIIVPGRMQAGSAPAPIIGPDGRYIMAPG